MKFKGYFFILILVVSGCTTYQLEPVVKQATNESPIKIHSYSISISENTKVWTRNDILEKTKESLNTSVRLDFVPVHTAQAKSNYHLDIDIKYWHGGAGGDSFISALSLGLIPTWGENKDLFIYKFDLYKNGELHHSNTYSVNEKHYSHILLLPFTIIDLVSPNKPLEYYVETLHANKNI
ncbi:hypothetical protein [Microbulbifer sp. JMSA008]|uniref:hypothetical protein n=1 Tax=Microbulbifer sp. JMSA008 TaxID=3243373 RepID=UPI00403A31D0